MKDEGRGNGDEIKGKMAMLLFFVLRPSSFILE